MFKKIFYPFLHFWACWAEKELCLKSQSIMYCIYQKWNRSSLTVKNSDLRKNKIKITNITRLKWFTIIKEPSTIDEFLNSDEDNIEINSNDKYPKNRKSDSDEDVLYYDEDYDELNKPFQNLKEVYNMIDKMKNKQKINQLSSNSDYKDSGLKTDSLEDIFEENELNDILSDIPVQEGVNQGLFIDQFNKEKRQANDLKYYEIDDDDDDDDDGDDGSYDIGDLNYNNNGKY